MVRGSVQLNALMRITRNMLVLRHASIFVFEGLVQPECVLLLARADGLLLTGCSSCASTRC